MTKNDPRHPGGRPTLGFGRKNKTSLSLTAEAIALAEAAAVEMSRRVGMTVSVADVFEAAVRAFNPRRFKRPPGKR
jgi:hypothetical protein